MSTMVALFFGITKIKLFSSGSAVIKTHVK